MDGYPAIYKFILTENIFYISDSISGHSRKLMYFVRSHRYLVVYYKLSDIRKLLFTLPVNPAALMMNRNQ